MDWKAPSWEAHRVPGQRHDEALPVPAVPPRYRVQGESVSKITESARGEMCMVRIPNVCLFHPETVIWAHANGSAAGKGMWMKSHDLLGAYACHACHDVYDRRRPAPIGSTRVDIELAFWEGHARSLLRLIEREIIVLKRGTVEIA